MLNSMTGFVSYERAVGDYTISWEIKTLNHRFFDMGFKLPENLRCMECELRNIARNAIKRGRMDILLTIKSKATDDVIHISPERMREIVEAFAEANATFAKKGLHPTINLADIFTHPAFRSGDTEAICEKIREQVRDSFQHAMKLLQAERRREGANMLECIQRLHCEMKGVIVDISELAKNMSQVIYNKFLERIKRINDNANSKLEYARLEQEVMLYAQKADIQEELDRLNSHLCKISLILDSEEPAGRTLDFLMQELNRETNTICSKAIDGKIISLAITLKSLTEQMREHIQNIE